MNAADLFGLFAQLQTRNRQGEATCVSEDGFCPDWIADNWQRYQDPFVEHVVLTLASVAAGFLIAFTLALIAHRRQWLIGPITGVHRRAVHDPQRGVLLPAAALHRAWARPPPSWR